MSLKITQKGGTQITAPLQNSAVFTQSEYASPQRNVFNLSKQTHGSLRFGKLYPVYSRMLMPGDSFKVQPSHFVRFASVISPILNKISISYSAFYVPFRLVWKFWPTFISGGYNNDGVYTDDMGNYLDANDKPTSTPFKPEIPRIDTTLELNDQSFVYDTTDGELCDWLGYPSFNSSSSKIDVINALTTASQRKAFRYNALPLMCYQKVINDWFINPNIKDVTRVYALPPANCTGVLEPHVEPDLLSDPLVKLAYINYGLDYFTSCLPYLQRGEAYTINSTGDSIVNDNDPQGQLLVNDNEIRSISPTLQQSSDVKSSTGNHLVFADPLNSNALTPQWIDIANSAHISYITTIQELRYVNALQKFAEKSLRVGTRYIDFLKCYFDVNSSNKSLQRSEFLGSAVYDVQKNTVSQTSASTYVDSALSKTTPLGTQATQLQSLEQSQSFSCYAEEHGMLFIMACVMPETIYNNRFKTELLYEDKEDFLFPEFTHLSPQAVKNAELFFPRARGQVNNLDFYGTFGYQDRYNELRTDTNDVHGDFKQSLSFFLQQRNFEVMPSLNTNFLKADDVDTSIFATDTVIDDKGTSYQVDQIWASFNFDVKATRLLPKLATPSLI